MQGAPIDRRIPFTRGFFQTGEDFPHRTRSVEVIIEKFPGIRENPEIRRSAKLLVGRHLSGPDRDSQFMLALGELALAPTGGRPE